MEITVETGGATLTLTLPDRLSDVEPNDVEMTELVMQQMLNMLIGALYSAPLTPVMLSVVSEQLLMSSYICLEVLRMGRDFVNKESPHTEFAAEDVEKPADKGIDYFAQIIEELDLGDDPVDGE